VYFPATIVIAAPIDLQKDSDGLIGYSSSSDSRLEHISNNGTYCNPWNQIRNRFYYVLIQNFRFLPVNSTLFLFGTTIAL
jgi:hypothetical protein